MFCTQAFIHHSDFGGKCLHIWTSWAIVVNMKHTEDILIRQLHNFKPSISQLPNESIPCQSLSAALEERARERKSAHVPGGISWNEVGELSCVTPENLQPPNSFTYWQLLEIRHTMNPDRLQFFIWHPNISPSLSAGSTGALPLGSLQEAHQCTTTSPRKQQLKSFVET